MKIGTIHVTRKVDGFNQPHDSVRFEGEVFFIDKYLLSFKWIVKKWKK